jgi:glucose/arabinose dehydrogenase
VHIRRALLLFAIVLGLAAIAASVSRTPDDSDESTSQPAVPSETEQAPSPSASPGDAAPVSGVRLLEFEADLDQTRRLNAGQPATVLVEVEEPGLVEIPDLGLSAPAEPLTPARFEILPSSPGRVDIEFTSAADDLPEPAGTLVVRETAEG